LKEGIFELKWRNQKDVAKDSARGSRGATGGEVTRGATAQPR